MSRPLPNVEYRGERIEKAGRASVKVVVNGVPHELDPRNDLFNHSPDGFQWGYGGSGPAQLALALLADWLVRVGMPKATADEAATRYHQTFKATAVAGIQGDSWTLTAEQMRNICAAVAMNHNVPAAHLGG